MGVKWEEEKEDSGREGADRRGQIVLHGSRPVFPPRSHLGPLWVWALTGLLLKEIKGSVKEKHFSSTFFDLVPGGLQIKLTTTD